MKQTFTIEQQDFPKDFDFSIMGGQDKKGLDRSVDRCLSRVFVRPNCCPFKNAVDRQFPELKAKDVLFTQVFDQDDNLLAKIDHSFNYEDMKEVAFGTPFVTEIEIF